MSDPETVVLSRTPFARRQSEENDRNLRAMLVKHKWLYGPDRGDLTLGPVRFFENGIVSGYEHANERRWAVRSNILALLNDIGVPTTHFILLFGGDKPALLGRFLEDLESRWLLVCIDPQVNVDPSEGV